MLRCRRLGRYAGVAELVDAPGLGPGDCKVVGVQVPSPAPSIVEAKDLGSTARP